MFRLERRDRALFCLAESELYHADILFSGVVGWSAAGQAGEHRFLPKVFDPVLHS